MESEPLLLLLISLWQITLFKAPEEDTNEG
jgi:hypothetical protein